MPPREPPTATTIYPTGAAYIPGVPAVQQDVSPERAAELLAWTPAAFTTDPPPPADPAAADAPPTPQED